MLFRISRRRHIFRRLCLARAVRLYKRNNTPKMIFDHRGRDCIRLLDMWDDLHESQEDPVYGYDEVLDRIDPYFNEE